MRLLRNSLFLIYILVIASHHSAEADGILFSWGGNELQGVTEQSWENAKKLSPDDILNRNLKIHSWPDAYLLLVGAAQYKEDKQFLSGLVEQITNPTEHKLKSTNRLIIWERIAMGEILFEGRGLQVSDDLFTVCGRANWILRNITEKNFGYVKPKPTKQYLETLWGKWKGWLRGKEIQEFTNPFPAKESGLKEIRSLAALEALIISLQPSREKTRITEECLRNLYGLEALPKAADHPAQLCNPDSWVHEYLVILTEVSGKQTHDFWKKWWKRNKNNLVWDEEMGKFKLKTE